MGFKIGQIFPKLLPPSKLPFLAITLDKELDKIR